MMRFLVLLALAGLLAGPGLAQVSDDFADGDFTDNPAWTGTTDRWTIADLDGSPALRSNGPAEADTIYLATPSTVSQGTWRITFSHQDVNLSNFNGARVFLMADRADLTGPVLGYFLQLGTNNSDEIRLYRQDGAPSSASNRVELAASAAPLLDGDANTLPLEVTRSEDGTWTVTADGAELFTVADATYATSTHFGLWVKHTSTTGTSFFFDDVDVTGESGPVDATPPVVTDGLYLEARPGFQIDFSEPLDATTVAASDFNIETVGAPVDVTPDPPGSSASRFILDLTPNQSLPNGDYDIAIRDVADVAGNLLRDTTITVTVAVETDTTAPVVERVEAVEAAQIDVQYSEAVNGCRAEVYTISDGIGMPATVTCPSDPGDPPPEFNPTAELELAVPLTPGATYTLTVTDVQDEAGNPLADTTVAFTFFEEGGLLPAPGEVVVNEIMYDPPTTDLEYIELLNRTDTAFNLALLTFSDERGQRVPVSGQDRALPPAGYAVLVRDAAAFQQAFPDVTFIEPPSWPALNNGGDAVVLVADTAIVDSVAYRSSWGGDGVALERIDPGGPSNASVNWGSTTDPRGGTPGAQNSIFAVDTEPPQLRAVVPSTDGAQLSATFSEPLDPASVTPSAFTLAPEVTSITETTAADAIVTLVLSTALPTGDYTLTVQGVRDLKGNAQEEDAGAFSFVRPGTPDARDIVVNEIMYDPPEAGLEFVELFNRSEDTFDLRRFTLADNRGDAVPLAEVPTSLAPGAYAVLVQDAEAFSQAFPDVAFLAVPGWPTLNNGGDAVVLSVDGVAIDSVKYTPTWGGDGVSLERIDPAGASNSRFNWASSLVAAGATPGVQNSRFAPDVAPPQPIFAEQTDEDEVEVFFDEPLDPPSVTSDDFQLADGRSPRLVFLLGDNTSVLLRFDEALTGGTLAVEAVRDLKGNALEAATVALAYQPTPGALLLNEIMYDPLSDPDDGRPDQPEYVELYNITPRPLSLRGLYWTDMPDENGEADTLRLGTSFRVVLPDSFAVAFANGNAPEDQNALEAAFPTLAFDASALLPQDRSSLSLVNSGDLIRLHRADDAVLDEVFYDPDWHNPNLRDATGVALERISPTAPSDDATNWVSSVADAGGTPGRTNRVALGPSTPQTDAGLMIAPSPFSPNGDGVEDQTRIQFTLSSPVSLVRARLYDARGRHVRTLEQASLVGRTGELVWDGLDDDGNDLRMGIYVVLLEAIDTDGGTTEAFKVPVVLARPLN